MALKRSLKTHRSESAVSKPSAKAAFLRSALKLFVRDGVDATSIREIARATPYTNAAMFKHFANKDVLALRLFEKCYDWVAASVAVPIEPTSYAERMRVVIARYLAVMDADLEAALYMQENLRRYWPQLPKSTHRISLLSHMRGVIASGIEQGHVSPDHNPRLLVAAIIGLLGQFARMLYFNEFKGPAINYSKAISDLVLGMGRRT